MVKNIGVDIIEMERFESFLDNEKKLTRILSLEEIIVLNSLASRTRKLEYIAGRFAVKEALIKAGLKFNYTDVSVLNQEDGSPYIKSDCENNILVSISHNRSQTIAFVIVIESCF